MRLASQLSLHIRRADLVPGTDDCGDYVVVKNAAKVAVTGRKADQKIYRHHTQFPGGLKEIPFKVMLERNPEEVRSGSDSPSLCYASLAWRACVPAVDQIVHAVLLC